LEENSNPPSWSIGGDSNRPSAAGAAAAAVGGATAAAVAGTGAATARLNPFQNC
jgi:hypothetical protein